MVSECPNTSGDELDGERNMTLPGVENEDAESAICEADSPPAPVVLKEEPMKWEFGVIVLCVYGFMSNIKPGEPFITPNLLSVEKNFTREQVTNEITPVLTYSYMAVLVPAFLLTDLLRYKPVLVIQGLSQVVIWLLLLLGSSLLQMQFMEFFYGVTMACRVAYSSYIFSLVSPDLFQRVASYSRSAVLLGVFTSSVLGQLCLSLGNITFYTLSAISLGFVSFGLLVAICLPWPKQSLIFNRQGKALERDNQDNVEPTPTPTPTPTPPPTPPNQPKWMSFVIVQMLLELKLVAKKPNLRLWSLWWIFNSTGYYLVLFYVHILWNKVYPATESYKVYNGAVEAASTLLSALTSFFAGSVKMRWNIWSELLIAVITTIQAGLLLLMGNTTNIWVCYVAYVLFRGSYQFLVPLATYQIAFSLTKELCALVFGINTFLGTILKSIINLIFSDKRGLGLDVHSQFLVYFIYFAILTVVYVVSAAVVITRHFRNGDSEASDVPNELTPVAAASETEPLSNGNSVNS